MGQGDAPDLPYSPNVTFNYHDHTVYKYVDSGPSTTTTTTGLESINTHGNPPPDTRLAELANPNALGYIQDPQPGNGENYYLHQPGVFEWAYVCASNADQNVAGDLPQQWNTINTKLLDAVQNFQQTLTNLSASGDAGQGNTFNALIDNLSYSYHIPTSAAAGANNLSIGNDAFSKVVAASINAFVPNFEGYRDAMAAFPEKQDYIRTQYDLYAMYFFGNPNGYNHHMTQLATTMPGFNAGSPPPVGGIDPTGSGTGIGNGTTSGTGRLPGGGPGAGLGGPVGGGANIPNIPNPALASANIPNIPNPSQVPTDPSAVTPPPTSGSSGLSDLAPLAESAQGLSSPLQSLGQMASNAAQQAGRPGVGSAVSGPGKLPLKEGALAKELNKGGAGSGAGAGRGGAAIGKLAGAPSTATNTTAGRSVPAASRAGISNAMGNAGAGAPGAGAPAAGQQGAAKGGQHQSNKALRTKQNGEEIIGDTEAVVPVLGEPTNTETTKSEPTGPDSDTIQRREDRPRRPSPVSMPGFPAK